MNFKRLASLAVALLALAFLIQPAFAQSTIATGGIQGSVTDPQGAGVPNAKVTITNKATGEVFDSLTTSSGTYNAGSLKPGVYEVRVEAPNFKTLSTSLTVEVGIITNGNAKLELGSSATVVEVTGEAVSVNTDQAQVSGVLGTEQIENLPINGRNFLDLAQLEPGVQIQDGSNFDPTKNGFSSISFGGRFGRTARIEVDGVDVSDETVGTTTTDVPSSAIQEFQLAQSSLDLSNELTSSGAVNVVTRSGTNTVHGEAYGQFRDSSLAARLPGPSGAPPGTFQRSQFGGNVGGPIIKDKFFFFVDGERTLQAEQSPISLPAPFNTLSGTAPSPFHELDTLVKADYQLSKTTHLFYRFSYFQNAIEGSFGAATFSPYFDKNRTRSHVAGADFTTGQFTHSIRFEYLKFQNNLVDAVRGTALPLANFPISTDFVSQGLDTGPSDLAPQETPQSDRQLKYDGSKVWGSHILRYGVSYNHIQGGGYAKFFGIAPLAINVFGNSLNPAFPNANTDPNPLDYAMDEVLIGNGQGFSTEKSAFGFKNGGLGPDNRIGLYFGDSWKIKPNLTLTYGVRYSRDTGRTDSDLNTLQSLNNLIPGVGDPVQQANKNFGPQVGLAWDPFKDGKTVIRAGIGEYYENVIYNNVLFDRPLRLQSGQFLSFPVACFFGQETNVSFPGVGTQTLPAGTCSESIGDAGSAIAAFQTAYQAATAAAGPGPNPNYLPTQIANGQQIPLGLFAPAYKTPRSVQMNVGVQRQISRGTVLSVDYLRNVSLHYGLSVDVNHSGDVAYFDPNRANAAVASTLAACGAGSIDAAIASCAPLDGPGHGATIADFAGNGLDSANDLGSQCPQCAFTGTNPNVGSFPVLEPIGRGVYNGLDVKLVQNLDHPLPGIRHVNFEASYTFSRFSNDGGYSATTPGAPGVADQDFVIQAMDNRNPAKYFGPSTLDRENQLNFGGYADLPFWFRVGLVAHFWSPLSTGLYVPGNGTGTIFQTDFDGDGTTQDPIPGTKNGSFGHGVSTGGLTSLVNNYNSSVAGTFTPAGNVLINNGIFTPAQLTALGGVAPSIPTGTLGAGNIGLSTMRAFDLKISWEGKFFGERLRVEPSAALYNLFNFANYDPPGDILSGLLTGAVGTLNGTTKNGATAHTNQIGVGTGVFSLGAPRVAEFGLKLTF
jgi:carboxypeptidase family protein